MAEETERWHLPQAQYAECAREAGAESRRALVDMTRRLSNGRDSGPVLQGALAAILEHFLFECHMPAAQVRAEIIEQIDNFLPQLTRQYALTHGDAKGSA